MWDGEAFARRNPTDIDLKSTEDESMDFEIKLESDHDDSIDSSVLKAEEKCLMSSDYIRKVYENSELVSKESKGKVTIATVKKEAPDRTSEDMSNKDDVSKNDEVIQCTNKEIKTISCCWLHRPTPAGFL